MSTLALYPRSLGNRANRVEGAATKEQGACSKDRGWGALVSMGEYSNNQTISIYVIVIDFWARQKNLREYITIMEKAPTY